MSIAQIETITPTVAKAYLEKNSNNRNINKSHVAFLAKELLDGNYQMNGQSIVIGKSGRLLDGQHRLTAVIRAGVPISAVVVHGVDEESFVTMDTGKPRGGADALTIAGAKFTNHMASAIRKIIEKFSQKRTAFDGTTCKLSNTEYTRFYQEHDEELLGLFEMAHAWVLKGNRVLSESDAMAFIVLLRDESNEIYDFLQEVITGIRLKDSSNAAQTCRKKLLDMGIAGMQIRESQKRDWVISAFRNYVKDKNISKIQIRNPMKFKAPKEPFFKRLIA